MIGYPLKILGGKINCRTLIIRTIQVLRFCFSLSIASFVIVVIALQIAFARGDEKVRHANLFHSVPDRSAFFLPDCQPNQTRPTITLDVLCVSLRDDDGGRAVPTTFRDYSDGVAWMNRVYEPAGIHFRTHAIDLKNSRLNSLQGLGDVSSPAVREELDQLRKANGLDDRALVVLYRWGSGAKPNGQGLGGYPFREVLLSARSMTNAGPSMMAHEIGHALGLGHTFDALRSYDEALAYLQAHGNDPNCFDGDGLDDTPPDPGLPFHVVDGKPTNLRTNQFQLGNTWLTLPKGNLMSYIGQETLSPKQVQIARWHALSILRRNAVEGVAIEAEALLHTAKGPILWQIQDMNPFGTKGWSRAKTLFSKVHQRESATFSLPVKPGKTYRINMYSTQAPDYTDIDVMVDGTVVLNDSPMYAPIVMPSGKLLLSEAYRATSDHVSITVAPNSAHWNPSRPVIDINAFSINEVK